MMENLSRRNRIAKMKLKIKKILVPLDGSKNSLKGLEEAIYLANR